MAGWGWAGAAAELVVAESDQILDGLSDHHRRLMVQPPSELQRRAWDEEVGVVTSALRECLDSVMESAEWGVVLEYELPLEGGRRPDVVLLAGETIVVLEFKSALLAPSLAAIDQVSAYARNLAEYHEVTHEYGLGRKERSVIPVLVLPRTRGTLADHDNALVVSPDRLADLLEQLATPGSIELQAWLESAYAPLPTLVRAAKTIFEHEDLPHVRRARSARIPESVDLVVDLARQAQAESARYLILVSGVPGAGKTLVGLRAVYEHSTDTSVATFLSGNGPLVQVLQDALKSRVFVRDLHAYIRTYGINHRQPKEHVVVFDEAQRAWDREYMRLKKDVNSSEPELLIDAAMRLPGWAAFVGLVGDGQEIHSGEEGGIGQWAQAITDHSPEQWVVHCPRRLVDEFSPLAVVEHELLDLTTSLRSHEAERLHEWVAALLNGDITQAAGLAEEIAETEFVMYLSRDLDEIADYCRARYEEDPIARFGLVSSSHARNLPASGVDNSWIVTSRMNLARWYNADPDDPDSCCQLRRPVTEFGCQGLELDMPIVAWGSDMTWMGTDWDLKPIRRRHPLEDPEAILQNVYRVLLTRGRDGFVIFVPPASQLDETTRVLLRSGVNHLQFLSARHSR